MKSSERFSLAFLGMATLLTPALLPTLAHADSIDFSQPTSISVTEGDSTILAITITNNLGAPIAAEGVSSFSFPPPQGDPSDSPDSAVTLDPNHTCGVPLILANGASCSLDFLVQTDSAMGESDFDFGANVLTFTWNYLAPGGGANVGVTDPNGITITISDPAPVPEPASLMFFGSVIAITCGLFERQAIRGRTSSRPGVAENQTQAKL